MIVGDLKSGVTKHTHVHIVLSDRGWIIEECARQLAERLPYVSLGIDPDPAATIQYYMTYSARRQRVSAVEVALFTHREDDPNAAQLFNDTAVEVDHAIAMSRATEELIKRLGVEHRTCISPGVDLDRFRPRIKIAVVGRTYHTGRKGEALVRAVMDVPDIEWHFTGEGWPEPGQHVSQAELPNFYRSMDYILVPATNEGGPMSILEALACGVPVIASDVGWAGEFPHIPFERGDAASLRSVLEQLRAEQFALREHVTDITWQNWAEAHGRLFESLAPAGAACMPSPKLQRNLRSVALLTHGAEDVTLGGPSVRVPRTRNELAGLGLRVTAHNQVNEIVAQADVVHGFNIWSPIEAYHMARQVERLGRPFVFSPILLDLAEAPFWQADLLRAFRAAADPKDAEERIKDAFAAYHHRTLSPVDFEPGYTAALTAINELASATIFLSNRERELFERLVGAPPVNPFLVHNPVDSAHFNTADPDLFRTTYGLNDYVLCVGRLEHRKNQLMLATALASTELPLVLIGHEPEAEYAELIRRFGGPNLHMLGRIDPKSPLLPSAISGARVFALPSWAEGAPLAALEAASSGVPMVLSDRSSEQEYFGDFAYYCDPSSITSIRENIVRAWEAPPHRGSREALRQLVREQYDWSTHAQATRAVYEAAADARTTSAASSPLITSAIDVPATKVVFDITTWANNPDTLSGIVRVECAIARALLARDDIPVRFVVYVDFENFVEVPRDVVTFGLIGSFSKILRAGLSQPLVPLDFTDFTDLVTVGSSWMQSSTYAASLASFARKHDLQLSVLMHDLTPHLFPHWYNPGYADIWNANCRAIISHANRILVYSDSTARDVSKFCQTQGVDVPPLVKIRLADEIGDFAASETSSKDNSVHDWLLNRPFVLAVGALHARKNYGLLYDVWTILRDRMGDDAPYLIIVGGVAWNGQDIARAIREDSRVNTHIRILEDVDDGMLSWLYEQSLFTAYPSLYEGWGLPVGESLARGKICLASAISSMPEIAPHVTDLLPPMDRSSWAARIEHYARSRSSREAREREIRAGFAVTAWTQTTSDIVLALGTPSCAPALNHYLAGSLALLGGASASPFLEKGWYPAESWGVWAGSKQATLAFHLAGQPKGDMVLTILGHVFKRPEDRCVFRVSVNEIVCGQVVFDAELGPNEIEQSIARVRVPGHVLVQDGPVRITFETGTLIRVCDIDPDSNDVRRIGLGLCAFMLESEENAGDAPRFFSTRPEVREVLNTPIHLDLARMLADYSGRRSIAPNLWVKGLDPFLRAGRALGEGAASINGLLTLATGTARLRLAQDAIVDLLINIDQLAAITTAIDFFANDNLITSISLGRGNTLVRICIPHTILGASDPLNLSLVSRATHTSPEFSVKKLRIRQEFLPNSIEISCDENINLSDFLPTIAYNTLGQTEIVVSIFAPPPVFADAVVQINGCRRRIAAVDVNGEAAAFGADNAGNAIIPLSHKGCKLQEVKLRLSTELLEGCHVDGNAHVALRRLATLDDPLWGDAPRFAHFGDWNEIGEDGILWGKGSTLSFWVRPGAATSVIVKAEHIEGPEKSSRIAASVDGIKANVSIVPENDTDRFDIHIPLSSSSSTFRLITFSGVSSARPIDLNINLDVRNLSLRMIDISGCFSPHPVS